MLEINIKMAGGSNSLHVILNTTEGRLKSTVPFSPLAGWAHTLDLAPGQLPGLQSHAVICSSVVTVYVGQDITLLPVLMLVR